MPNSNEGTVAGGGCLERVKARDNRHESLTVLLTVAGLLAIAGVLLVRGYQVPQAQPKLPADLTNTVTQLSNAAVEIGVMQELSLLAPTPSLAELVAAQLPPFAEHDVTEPVPGCFLLDLEPYQVRFKQLREPGAASNADARSGWQLAWMDERDIPGFSHASHTGEGAVSLCGDHDEWRIVESDAADT